MPEPSRCRAALSTAAESITAVICRTAGPQPRFWRLWPLRKDGRLRTVLTSPPPLAKRLIAALGLAALALAGVGLLGALAGVAAGVQDKPTVPVATAVSERDITRAMQLLQRHDPRGRLPGITRQIELGDRDLTLLALYAGRRLGEPRVAVKLHPAWAQVQASLALPSVWRLGLPRGWLNVELHLAEQHGLPAISSLRIGHVPVPAWLARDAVPPLLALLKLGPQAELVRRLVSQVNFWPGQLGLAYAWPDDLQRTLASGLLPAAEQARVAVYSDLLRQVAADLGAPQAAPSGTARPKTQAASAPRELSMAQLLPPVFALARQRSADSAAAVLENRAALTALALLVNTLPQAPRRAAPGVDAGYNVTLLGRQDTPLHFLISAALSAEGGAALSNAVGLYKELSDSKGGSGFSFNDLAADRAGTRLGRLAVRDPMAFQARLAAGVQEDDLMPMVADLPEALTQLEFLRRYGGVGGLAYQQMLQDIEARLDRLALLASGQ